MRSVHQALSALLDRVEALPPIRIALPDAVGTVVAEDILARSPSPPFANSAMDGYAIRAVDLDGAAEGSPVRLPVVGESRAGTRAPDPLAPGSVMRIFTGAPMPPGADSVELQENTEREGDRASFRRPIAPGKNVRQEGEDAAVGDVLFATGSPLLPADLGVLASQGYAELAVVQRPRVAILSTGDELRDLDQPPEPRTIVNSNAYMLEAQCRAAGAEPTRLPIVPDDRAEIEGAIGDALRDHDLVLTSGGVSVGDHDHVLDAMRGAGVTIDFWKVAIKPGKPIAVGTASHDGAPRWSIGLPGNPVSAMVTFEIFVAPLLRKLAGRSHPVAPLVKARLGATIRHRPGRVEMVRAKMNVSGDGALIATPIPRRGSGALPALAGVDSLIAVPASTELLNEGDEVRVLLLHGGLMTASLDSYQGLD